LSKIEDPELVSGLHKGPKRRGLAALRITKEQDLVKRFD